MADSNIKPVLSAWTTVDSKVTDLGINDGQLIFVRDKHKIALDFDGKRTFYSLIEELATDGARMSMLAPITGLYYYVIETAVIWTYRDGWVQITAPPAEITVLVDDALAQAKESGEFNGADGEDGYSPVRGTDYWTEADKAEIKAYVDEAILGGAW